MTTFTIRFGDGLPPQDDGKGTLNAQVKESINLLIFRYRHYHQIPEWTVLTPAQIEDLLSGIRDIVYKHEGISKPKKE